MQKTSRLKKLALLLIPAALVLSACESKNELQINEDGTGQMTINISDDTGLLSMAGLTCDALSGEFAKGFGSSDFDLQDNSDGNKIDCSLKVVSDQSIVDGTNVTENDETFEVNISPDQLGIASSDLEMFNSMAGDSSFELAIVTPGEIVEAEATVEGESGESVISIDGNRAVITNLLALSNPIKVVGKKTADASSSTTNSDSDNGSTSSENSGFGMVAWILLGAILLGVIAVVAILLTRKKSNTDPYAGYGAAPVAAAPENIGYAPVVTTPEQQFGQGQPVQQSFGQPVQPHYTQPVGTEPVAPTAPIPTVDTAQEIASDIAPDSGQIPPTPTEPPAAPQA